MSDEGGSGSLVVIGASAGGIDALSVLAAHLPVPFPAPIVVAQHLDPSRQSHLVQILAQRTSLPVEAVTDHVALEAGHVYVIPPNSDVTVEDGHLSLDLLFRTAAGAYGERLIAVILSGAGSDGSGGARFVKAAGGTVVVQDPATASHPSMPSALPPAIVDLVAKLEAIGSLLRDLVAGEYPRSGGDDDTNLDHFLAELRERSGIDFLTYKRPTIRRRLDRRRLAVGATSLSAYMQYAAEHPEEYARLTSAFLIKVTEFFRDADLFEYLGTTVMPEIVRAAAERDHEIRIWSAGCASGEEAYGLAMLLADAVGNDLAAFNIRVFGTDLDGDAVNFARGATYPASAVATIPPDRLERYFIRSGADYEVRKHIRAMTVFGQHDLGMRSP
ncbi:MAG TPA: chemotaxis protein CheB, partial [Candidatus Limnocylindrales bacterium]|nr:chemotaxis protein CheB [Candidatus Limnocylindrales bacterium]